MQLKSVKNINAKILKIENALNTKVYTSILEYNVTLLKCTLMVFVNPMHSRL